MIRGSENKSKCEISDLLTDETKYNPNSEQIERTGGKAPPTKLYKRRASPRRMQYGSKPFPRVCKGNFNFFSNSL